MGYSDCDEMPEEAKRLNAKGDALILRMFKRKELDGFRDKESDLEEKRFELDNKEEELEDKEKGIAEKENRLIDKAIMLNNKEDELNHLSRKFSDKDSLLKRGDNELNANRHILFKKEAEFERKEGEKL